MVCSGVRLLGELRCVVVSLRSFVDDTMNLLHGVYLEFRQRRGYSAAEELANKRNPSELSRTRIGGWLALNNTTAEYAVITAIESWQYRSIETSTKSNATILSPAMAAA